MFLKRMSAALLVAGSMVASAYADDAPAQKGAKEERPDDLICSYEQPVGTHIKRRVCTTREQRDIQRRQSQDAAQRARSPSNSPGVGASGN